MPAAPSTTSTNGARRQASSTPAGRAQPANPPAYTSTDMATVAQAGRPEQAPVELGPGDYATFPGDVPHRYEALAPGTFAVLVMEHP